MVAPDFVNRGRSLSADGKHLEAIKVCRLGLLANPAVVDGRLVLGRALLALGRFDEVLAECRLIMQAHPENAGALRVKGEALLGRGDAAQAFAILDALNRRASDPELSALVVQARHLASNARTANLGQDDTAISWTRDYPAHHADSDSITEHFGAVQSDRITLPSDAPTEIEEPTFALATADTEFVEMSGDSPEGDFDSIGATVEVDPSLLEPPPPRVRTSVPISSARRTVLPPPTREPEATEASSGSIELSISDIESIDASTDVSSEELSIADLMPAADPRALALGPARVTKSDQLPGGRQEVRGFDSDFGGSPSEPTHGYLGEREDDKELDREAPLFLEREPDRPKSASFPTDSPPSLGVDGPSPTLPESPRSLKPSAPLNLEPEAPEVSKLFPEDEDGVSKLAIVDDVSGEIREPERERPEIADMAPAGQGPIRFGAGAEPTGDPRRADMRMIRVGLGLAPDPSQQNMKVAAAAEAPASPPAQESRPPAPVRTPARMAPPTRRVSQQEAQVLGRVQTRISTPLLVGLGILIVGGGVAGGVGLRSWRAQSAVDGAAERAAALTKTGSYLDHLRARSVLDRALEVADRDRLRVARARVGAELSVEFGVSETAPIALADDRTDHDARVTAIYRALARGETDLASASAEAFAKAFPRSADAAYLRGLVLADLGQLEGAAAALREPATNRPLARAHLADVLRLSGAPAAAVEQTGEGGPPSVVIARSRALARASKLPDGVEPETTLRNMVADSGRPPLEQTIGVSPSEGLEARLALIEVAIARGQSERARSELLALADLKLSAGTPFRVAYSEALLRTGDAEAASLQYALVAKAWPESVRTKILGARIHFALGDLRAARAELERIADVDALPRALAVRGQLALEAGRRDDAKKDLDRALMLAPGLEDAVLARARLDLAIGDPDKALAMIEALPAGLFGSGRDILKARALRAAGRLDEARAVLTGAASASGAEGMIELARLEVASGNVKAAIGVYKGILVKSPSHVNAALEGSLLRLDNGEGKAARKALDVLAAKLQNDPNVLISAARARSLTGEPARAVPLLDAAVKIPGAPLGLIERERGRALLGQRIYADAARSLEAALVAMPSDAESYILLMETVLSKEGTTEEAGALLKRAMGPLKDRTYEMSLLRGIRALVADEAAAAGTDFGAARRSAPKGTSKRERAMLEYWLGRSYETTGELGPARKALQSAIKLAPTLARAHLVLGDVELAARQIRTAEKSYKTAVEIDPIGNPRGFLMLGQIYVELRRSRQAKAALEQYLELDPRGAGAAEAKELLAQVK